MREIRLYGSEGGGAGRSPYPYQSTLAGTTCVSGKAELDSRFRGNDGLQMLDEEVRHRGADRRLLNAFPLEPQ